MPDESRAPRNVSRRHFLKGLAAIAGPSFLAACGAAPPTTSTAPTTAPAAPAATTAPAPTTAPAAAQAVNIVFATWANVFDQAKTDFNKSRSDIQVEVAISPYEGYGQKMLTQLAAGTAADVFWIPGGLFPGMVRKNVFAELDAYLQEADVAGLDADPKVWTSYSGKVYGLPAHVPVSFGLVYNKRLFEEAKLEAPKYVGWTMDDMEVAAKAIAKPPDVWGATVPNSFQISGLILSNNGKFFNEDMTQCLLNSPEARAVFEYPVNWVKNKFAPSAAEVQMLSQSGALFATDQFGIDTGVTLDWGTFKAMTKDTALPADMVLPPIMPRGKQVAVGITHSVSMPANGKQMQAGWEFLKWLSFDEVALKGLLASIPINYHMNELMQDATDAKQREIMTKPLEYVPTLVPDPWDIFAAEGGQIFNEETELMYLGKKSIEQATDDMVNRINEVLAENA